MSWKNSQVAITGAGSGIGRALAHALAKRGAQLWLTDIDGPSAQAVCEEIGSGHAQPLDVQDADAFRDHINGIVDAAGRIDVLFNNAGIGIGGDALDLQIDHYDRSLDVNVRGVVHGVGRVHRFRFDSRALPAFHRREDAFLFATRGGRRHALC